jgi:hypothetical protein
MYSSQHASPHLTEDFSDLFSQGRAKTASSLQKSVTPAVMRIGAHLESCFGLLKSISGGLRLIHVLRQSWSIDTGDFWRNPRGNAIPAETEIHTRMGKMKKGLAAAAPTVVAFSLIAGNVGLLCRRGLHPNLETAVGFLWIASDYALRQKQQHPVAAPRINAAGVILGSLCLAASGLHPHYVDWHRVRTPLGYIPAAAIIGFQKELRDAGVRFSASVLLFARVCGTILARPYTLAAVMNAYGVAELARSAIGIHDQGLLAISAAYGIATLALPLLDDGR